MTNDEENSKLFRHSVSLFLRISSFVIRIWEPRFMERPLGPATVHCDHEPTPNPSQEGNRRTHANACSPLGFVESPSALRPVIGTLNLDSRLLLLVILLLLSALRLRVRVRVRE